MVLFNLNVRDHHISLFSPGFDIAVRLSQFLQRITAIDDRFYLAGINQVGQEGQIFGFIAG